MKVAATFLVLLGLAAAGAATMLFKSLKSNRPVAAAVGQLGAEVTVLVATRDLGMLTIVDGSAVETRKVPRAQMPEGALLSSVQVVGKVITGTMLKGQPFTKSCFARQAEGVYLAASLPPGKRAISFSVSDWSGMAGLLYPGSVVDVLVSFKPTGGNAQGAETVCTTLLQGLQVLAIGSQSVAAEDFADKEPGALAKSGKVNFRMVTLLVDPKQAEILQLAIQNGNISLSMRNPLDTAREARRITRTEELVVSTTGGGGVASDPQMMAGFVASLAKFSGPAAPKKSGESLKEVPPDMWETLINRAGVVETKKFELTDKDKLAAGPTTAPAAE